MSNNNNKSTKNDTEKTRKLGKRTEYTQVVANARKDARRVDATIRNEKYNSLTTTQKLATVPVGGGTKQRTRLVAQLATEKAVAKTVPVVAKTKVVAKQAASSSSKTGSSSSKTGGVSSKTGGVSSKTRSVSSKTGGASSKR